MDSLRKARAALSQGCTADGSLGYLPGQPGRLEPTLLGIAAQAIDAPLDWLDAQPWSWEKLLLPAVLANHTDAASQVTATVSQLLTQRGQVVADPDNLLGFDASLQAWSWVDGTASWVEPTAYALLSLKRTRQDAHPRVQEGEALLVDRQCSDGGWNYGNPSVLGAILESDLAPTGWATLALQPGPVAERALTRLCDAVSQPSTTALSLAILAHRQHGRVAPAGMLEALLQRQRPDGDFGGRWDWTALAACALTALDGPHPFGVSA